MGAAHPPRHVASLAGSYHPVTWRCPRAASWPLTSTLTDRTLRYDGVRVLSRALGTATTLLQEMSTVAQEPLTDDAQQARAKMQRILEVARQRGEAAAERLGKPPIATASPCALRAWPGPRTGSTEKRATLLVTAQRVVKTLAQCLPVVEQGITQTTRRVLVGEQAPASEKIVSLFEPDTAIIRTGTPGKPTEFGRCVGLAEVEGGIISHSRADNGHRVWIITANSSGPHPTC